VWTASHRVQPTHENRNQRHAARVQRRLEESAGEMSNPDSATFNLAWRASKYGDGRRKLRKPTREPLNTSSVTCIHSHRTELGFTTQHAFPAKPDRSRRAFMAKPQSQ
jgi:hypothetical protein